LFKNMYFKRLVLSCAAVIFFLLTIFYKYVLVQQEIKENKLQVVCTTNIIADAIKNIAGDYIHLDMLMGPGVDPHLYKPIEQDVTKIAQADVIFYNGLHLEARMSDLFKNMQTIKTTVAVTQDIPVAKLIRSQEHEEYFDPHVWFDPKLWAYAVTTISQILQKHDPKHKNTYQKNSSIYLEKIANMYQVTRKKIATIPKHKRVLISAHDAFEYFARAYNCQVMSLQGISTASEAGTKDIQKLANFIISHKIPAIFLETSIPPRNIQAVQQNVASHGLTLKIGNELYSDALGTYGTKQGTYIGMLTYNVATIVQELR
tara:strand:- start:6362 stop:7309 length:948 start_codon:yes stop_codon:yes gene_type:complete